MNTKWIAALALLPTFAFAQTETTTENNLITTTAKGIDARVVLYDIFKQTQKNFVTEVGMNYPLYLNLCNVPFEEAIAVICKMIGVTHRVENNIYIFFKQKLGTPATYPILTMPGTPAPKPLDPKTLDKKLTIRMELQELKAVVAEIGKQTGTTIELGPEVRKLKLNAFLINTSLRFALNSITQSAGLVYTLTDKGTILISAPDATKTK